MLEVSLMMLFLFVLGAKGMDNSLQVWVPNDGIFKTKEHTFHQMVDLPYYVNFNEFKFQKEITFTAKVDFLDTLTPACRHDNGRDERVNSHKGLEFIRHLEYPMAFQWTDSFRNPNPSCDYNRQINDATLLTSTVLKDPRKGPATMVMCPQISQSSNSFSLEATPPQSGSNYPQFNGSLWFKSDNYEKKVMIVRSRWLNVEFKVKKVRYSTEKNVWSDWFNYEHDKCMFMKFELVGEGSIKLNAKFQDEIYNQTIKRQRPVPGMFQRLSTGNA